MALQITAGATPISYDEFRQKGYSYAGGYQGYIDAQAKATEQEATKRAGSSYQKDTTYLAEGQSASSQGRMFQTTGAQTIGGTNQPTKKTYAQEVSYQQDLAEFLRKQGKGYYKGAENDFNRFIGDPNNGIVDYRPGQAPPSPSDMAYGAGASDQYTAAEGMIEADMAKENELRAKYGFDKGPKTIEDVVAEQRKRQQQQMSYQQIQNARQNELDIAERDRFKAQADASKASIQASFAQGREGATSDTAISLRQEYVQSMNKRMTEADTRLKMAQDQRAQMLLQLEQAQKDRNSGLVESIGKSLAAAQVRIDESKTNLIKELNEFNKEARLAEAAAKKDALGFFEKMPVGSFASMELDQIAFTLDSFGISPTMAPVFKGLDNLRLTDKISNPDYIKKMNEAIYSGMAPDERNYVFYQQLLKTDVKAAESYAREKGFANTLSAKDAMDSQLKADKEAYDFFNENGFFPPQGKYNTTVDYGSKSVVFDVPIDADGGQCGRFANDAMGLPNFFGDLLKDKLAKAKTSGGFTYTSAAGFSGIMDVGTDYGHVFMVENVADNGDLSIVESNWDNNEKITRRTIRVGSADYKNIVGFVNPALVGDKKKSPFDAEFNALLTQIRSGRITDSDITKGRKLAKKAGRLDEFSRELADPKNKPVLESTAKSFGTPTDITKREFDAIVDRRTEERFGNRKFQEVMFSVSAQGNKELDNIQELYRMRRDLKLVEALKEGKSGWNKLSEEDQNHLQSYYGIKDEFWKGVETGSAEGRLSGVLAFFGYNDPSYLAIKNITGKYTADYMKSISGAAISEKEAQRLKSFMPDVTMQDAVFMTNLRTAQRELDYKLERNSKEWGFKNGDEAIMKIDQIGLGSLEDINEEVIDEMRANIVYGNESQLENDRKIYEDFNKVEYPDDL